MSLSIVSDVNPNEQFGVRACTFAGQVKSPDCGGKWFVISAQHVRVHDRNAPVVCACASHLAVALAAVNPPKPARKTRDDHRKANAELSL